MNGIKTMAGYNKYLIFIFLTFFINIFSLDHSVSDSLQTTADSLSVTTAETDTLVFATQSEIIDSLKLNQPLFSSITDIPFAFYENLHIFIPYNSYSIFELNRFSIFHPKFSESLYYQLFYPIYSLDYSDIKLFNTKEYHNLTPVLIAHTGIGSQDMNFAFLDFYKGAYKNKFDFNFSYIGEDGNWNLNNNPSKSFHLFGSLNLKNTSIAITKDIFKRKVPTFYIVGNNIDNNTTASVEIQREECAIKYKNFYISTQRFFSSINDTVSTDYQALVMQKIKYKNMMLIPKYEIIKNDSLTHLLNLKFKFYSRFLNAYFTYKNNLNNNFISSEISYSLNKVSGIGILYYQDRLYYNFYKRAFFIKYNGIKIYFGNLSNDNFVTNYFLLNQKNSFKFDKYNIIIQTNFLYNNKTSTNFPLAELKATLQITKNLKYNNKIFTGFEYYFATNDKGLNYYDIFLHPFFGFAITNKFSIQADFINVTNEYSYKTLYLSPFHINVGFKWIFFN